MNGRYPQMRRGTRMDAPLLSEEGWRGDVSSAAPGWFPNRTTPSAPATEASRHLFNGRSHPSLLRRGAPGRGFAGFYLVRVHRNRIPAFDFCTDLPKKDTMPVDCIWHSTAIE